jgi:type IV pilus assembly protein PilC
MSTYVFKAIDLAGGKARGEVEADSKQAVADQLKSRGLIVLDIADKHSSRELNIDILQRVKLADLAIMSRQLATMVASGMSILRALYVLEVQTQSKLLVDTIVTVRKDVEAGLAFSDALARHPKIFSELFVAMVRAGETGGVLESALLRVADQLESEASLRRQIRSAMVYPTLVIVFALGVMVALAAFLIPVFKNVFKQFPDPRTGKPIALPSITQVSVSMSDLITGSWYVLIAVAVVVVFAFLKWKKSKRGKAQWDRFRLRVPMKIGDIVQKVAIARWSRTLSALVGAGVPLLQALEITGKTAGNVVVDEAMTEVINSAKAGGTISEPLAKASIFPPMVTHMVGVGEETGALDTMLNKIADFYEDQVAAAVKALTAILEPIMIILIGSMVGFIVISMYLPLFKVYDAIR